MRLRQPQEIKARPASEQATATTLAAPIGGINARDSLANMDALDCVEGENWFGKTSSVDVRNGLTEWSTFTGVCETILVYNGLTATKIFPCVDAGATHSIYNGTSAGALSVAVVGGGGATIEALTNARFDYQNFGTAAGQFLTVVNGSDVPLQYDGTTWIASAMTGGTPANFFTVAVYARRLFYGVKDSMTVRYLPVISITGATVAFELGPEFKLGGSLNSIVTVTDNSNGLDSYIGFLSTEGEIVAYGGTDPAVAADWQKVAHFRIGRPVTKGNRCWCAWGSDALVLCADGLYPLRAAIQAGNRSGGLAVSDKIRNAINGDLAIHGARFGWQVMVHPTGGKLFVNVPTLESISSRQWVMNTETGSWWKFTGWNGFSFEVARDTLYMGSDGEMVKADQGTSDLGTAITALCTQAYNYLGKLGRIKNMTYAQPIFAANGEFQLGLTVNTDFRDSSITYLRPLSGGSGDPWGGIWDVAWSGGMVASTGWFGLPGLGKAIAFKLKIIVDDVQLSWQATTLMFEYGGILG